MADGLQNIGNMLAGFGAGVQGRGPEFLQGLDKRRAVQKELSDERKKALIQDVAVGLDHLENDNTGMAIKLFEERVNAIKQLGGDDTESRGTLEDLRAGKIDKVKDNLKSVVRAAQIRGILPATSTSKFLELDKERGLAYFSTPEGVVSQDIAGLEGRPPVAPEEIRKETRGEVRKQVGAIDKEANVIKSNWKKLNNLAGEIKKGNRQAVPQALVAIVKLGDPGSIVSTNEMRGAINAEDPVSAVFNLLTSKGVDSDLSQSIASKIDPLNPENINVDDLLATGSATVSAFVPSLQARLASAEEQAAGTLTEAGIKSLFTESFRNRIAGLSELLPTQEGGALPPVSAPQAPTTQGVLPAAKVGRFEVKPL
jgi:hypothetical protein